MYPTSYYIALGTNVGNYRNNFSKAVFELNKIGSVLKIANIYKSKPYGYLKQIQYIKSLSIPVFVGGGINENKAKAIINLLNPDGIDVSRSLKNTKNVISSKKLKNFLEQVAIA